MRVAVVGCGLIGGSLAIALARAGVDVTILDPDPAATRLIEARGGGRPAVTLREVIDGADVIAIAAPSAAFGDVVDELAALGGDAAVCDVGGLKALVVPAGERALGGRFVGAHPMAGNAGQGAASAEDDLFRGRPCAITPTPRTDPAALAAVEAMWTRVGATLVRVEPAAHDAVMAAVSHLPHVAAYAQAAVIGATPTVRALAGPSYDSNTRVAGAPTDHWVRAFIAARAELEPICDALADRVRAIGKAAAAGDEATLRVLLDEGRGARRGVRGA